MLTTKSVPRFQVFSVSIVYRGLPKETLTDFEWHHSYLKKEMVLILNLPPQPKKKWHSKNQKSTPFTVFPGKTWKNLPPHPTTGHSKIPVTFWSCAWCQRWSILGINPQVGWFEGPRSWFPNDTNFWGKLRPQVIISNHFLGSVSSKGHQLGVF